MKYRKELRDRFSLANKSPLLMTSWRATGACNARCRYCNVDATGKHAEKELTTKEALHLVDEVHKFGVKWFGIKGGEPLMRKDIFEIVSYAKSLGLNVCLLTNGCFVDGEIYDNLIKNQVWTSVSIDGPEEINDALRGKGSYKKALAAIQKLSKGNILNGLACAITAVNYKDLQPMDPQQFGNIREKSLKTTWEEIQKSDFYNSFRDRSHLKGKCGVCEYRELCGGCRNRAYAYTGDLFESDPACVYIPESLRKR